MVHLLDERGTIHIDDPVAEYIPEYGRHGKDEITIAPRARPPRRRADIPGEALDLEASTTASSSVKAIVRREAVLAAGQLLAYHAVSGGFILGEVVYAVTGETSATCSRARSSTRSTSAG